MASVKASDNQSTVLAALPTTLLFDTFKSSQEDEKESDEESFHLPMLDCDEDTQADKNIDNLAEAEDDILNKLDAEISNMSENAENVDKSNDPKDKSCNETEKGDSVNAATDASENEKSEEESGEHRKVSENVSEPCIDKENIEKERNGDQSQEESEDNMKGNENKNTKDGALSGLQGKAEDVLQNSASNEREINNRVKATIEETEKMEEERLLEDEDNDDADEQNEKKNEKLHEDDNITNDINVDLIETEAEGADDKKDAEDEAEEVMDVEDSTENAAKGYEKENSEVILDDDTGSKAEVDEDAMLMDDEDILNPVLTDETLEDEDAKVAKKTDGPDKVVVECNQKYNNDDSNKEGVVDDEIVDNSRTNEKKNSSDNSLKSNMDDIQVTTDRSPGEPNDSNSDVTDEQTLSAAQSDPSEKRCQSKKGAEDDEEQSNDNLLDISVIRDVDEDNATAAAEEENDVQSSDKSDNDDQEQDDEKGDDVEDSEPDQEMSVDDADKEENVDLEDETSNVCGSVTEESSCDTDSNAKKDSATDDSNSGNVKETVPEQISAKGSEGEGVVTFVNDTVKPTNELTDRVMNSGTNNTDEAVEENKPVEQKKRSLSGDEIETISKKPRLSTNEEVNAEVSQPVQKPTLSTLIGFEKFMKSRKLQKLTRSDLEQFCIQKICEAFLHKTQLGESHQTIKKQEQTIENLRKDMQQLLKQTRDLEIVYKKLWNELKTQGETKKPLVPLKITRSVGLQVKLNTTIEPVRRKTPISTTTTTNTTPLRTPGSPAVVNRSRNVAQTPPPNNRQATTTSVRKPAPPQLSTPILSQALSNSNAGQRPSPNPSPMSPMKRVQQTQVRKSPGMSDLQRGTPVKQQQALAKGPGGCAPSKGPGGNTSTTLQSSKPQPGVIDLTDEDDRTAKTGISPAKKHPPSLAGKVMSQIPQPKGAMGKTVTKVSGATNRNPVSGITQGVRIASNQMNGIAIPVNTSTGSTTQLMYVVQPSSLVTSTANSSQKTLLLNLPKNGVFSSAINGSTVSVLSSSKTTGGVQVKQLSPGRKHPAPLPLPPPVPVNSKLKPVLPKPHLGIKKTDKGIILSWNMPYNLDNYENIASYQLFAYQETNALPSTDMWRKVGDVKALALPMACTLTQFADKNKYYFAVRSVDVFQRIGAFSDPEEISL